MLGNGAWQLLQSRSSPQAQQVCLAPTAAMMEIRQMVSSLAYVLTTCTLHPPRSSDHAYRGRTCKEALSFKPERSLGVFTVFFNKDLLSDALMSLL